MYMHGPPISRESINNIESNDNVICQVALYYTVPTATMYTVKYECICTNKCVYMHCIQLYIIFRTYTYIRIYSHA